ncbi:unnamed protein product [Pararhodospirillum photometricum DSM 122]|uniref:Uncharacterized protein n=1 Tax=Pararhodospirillum photometricum DSM 122 TaxID=1150469 RepID=H6SPE5_PARPM|nr:unnamed protein product [Pararhodospirillum photometricum DSM 122]
MSGRATPGREDRVLPDFFGGFLSPPLRPELSFEGGRWEFDEVFLGLPTSASNSSTRAAKRSINAA